MNENVKRYTARLTGNAIQLKLLAEALFRGENWADFSEEAKHHGTRWAIGRRVEEIQRLCDSIDKEWTE